MVTRRRFLQTAAVAAVAPAATPKRIALLAASYRPQSNAQLWGDRLFIGYPYAGAWHKPEIRLDSLYLAEKPPDDLGAARAREFDCQIYPSVAEALRAGGPKLAVDAVFAISGRDDDGLFEQCVEVFERDGHSVPVYHNIPYAAGFEKMSQRLATARRLRFALWAGSPMPFTWRLPAIDLPSGCHVEEAVFVSGASGSPADIHAFEGLQSMVERRRGGETGVRAVQFLEGEAVWQALDAGRIAKPLVTSALSRSDTPLGLTVQDGRTQDLVASGQLRVLAKNPAAYCIEYRDGLKAALLMLEGALKDHNFAARLAGGEVPSTQFLVTPEPDLTFANNLLHKVEEMFLSGRAPSPAERTLLAVGVAEAGKTSRDRNHARIETPHLNLAYRPPDKSEFPQV